jgi:cbb3-type cytochrome oxidase maturation protein
MNVVIVLMLASLAVGLVFVGAFVWSVRNGQYEDTLTPAMRVLTDEAAAPAVMAEKILPADEPGSGGRPSGPGKAAAKPTV